MRKAVILTFLLALVIAFTACRGGNGDATGDGAGVAGDHDTVFPPTTFTVWDG